MGKAELPLHAPGTQLDRGYIGQSVPRPNAQRLLQGRGAFIDDLRFPRLAHVAFFRSPIADGILVRASQLGFRPERLRLYQRLQAHVAEEIPYVPIYARRQWLLARPGVRDLAADAGGRVRLERAWIEEASR